MIAVALAHAALELLALGLAPFAAVAAALAFLAQLVLG